VRARRQTLGRRAVFPCCKEHTHVVIKCQLGTVFAFSPPLNEDHPLVTDETGSLILGSGKDHQNNALPQPRFSRILKAMEVHFSPDVETRLQQVAVANGKEAEQLVKDTVARMLENQARFIAGVQKSIEQADHGELVEHKDVLNRIDRLFQ
jgi:predicted transcriptional regulator